MILLRSIPGGENIINGELKLPEPISGSASANEVTEHKNNSDYYNSANIKAMLILTSNMTEEVLTKVMRFSSAREIWLELHRLYEGATEDKTYNLCMQFFTYKISNDDDMADHLSKLKNIWNSLNLEMAKGDNAVSLPDILLICKIIETLPTEYFSFKSSWLLMPKSERSIDNLTAQLCAHEKALKGNLESNSYKRDEALSVMNSSRNSKFKGKPNIICHYCKRSGHVVKNCIKWKKDGRPPKPKEEAKANSNMVLFVSSNEAFSSVSDNFNWYIDNGATNHVCNNKKLFKFVKPFESPHTVMTANGDCVSATGYGDVDIKAYFNGKYNTITLSNVWLVPGINKNLFSVLSAQDKNPSSKFVSYTEKCSFEVKGKTVLTGRRSRHGGLYKLNVVNECDNVKSVNAVSDSRSTLQLYHERLGHQNKRHVKKVIERELNIKVSVDSEICEGCAYGKAHKLKFGTRERATVPGEVIHADVCGPFEKSFSGYRYYVLFKDDFTRYRFIYFIKQKSEVYDKFLLVIKECERVGHKIKSFLSDNGGEFDNSKMKDILDKHGIEQILTIPYCSEMNGYIERDNRTVVEAARAMLHAHGDLPQALWAEFTNTAVYILNRSGPSAAEDKSPFELWFGKKASLKHLRIIGSECYVHVPKQNRRKMDKKSVKGILVGYDFGGYRIWNKCNKKIIRSRDVIFMEDPLLPKVSVSLPNDEAKRKLNDQDVSKEGGNTEDDPNEDFVGFPSENSQDNDELYTSNEENEGDHSSLKMNLRNRESIRPPERFREEVTFVMTEDLETPETYQQAVTSKDSEHWKNAMNEEINALKENGTWILENLPSDKKALQCKWVFKIKRNPDDSVERYKARLVVKGFSQQKGVNYNETFSPVAKIGTIRTLLSVAASENMTLAQFDVSTAFLYGNLSEGEEIFMRQPEGFEDGSDSVCKLRKSLYGLKQAARCWYKRFVDFLERLGFVASQADPCLFIKKEGQNKIFLALYVDDGLVASNNKKDFEDFLNKLKEEFKVRSKPLSFFLGLEISREEDGSVRIDQKAYAKQVLERFGMYDCKPVSTPIISSQPEEYSQLEKETKFPYRQAVGALMYLMISTRPDLAFAVGVASRSLENPSPEDVIRVKRILRYLKGTISLGIIYKAGEEKVLQGYSDADHGGDLSTGRSTTGVLCRFAGSPISWLSQRQTSVAISTTEAEVVAASEAARELIWLKRLLDELTDLTKIPVLFVDNEAAIKLAKNPEYHRRTKHIRLRHFFVREVVQEGIVSIQPISSDDQLADMFTKPIHKPKLIKFLNDMEVVENIKSLFNEGEC